ncbi:MAG: DUF2726 domain-containing protein [Alphaproteobacteria bacterium]|nr:DUF2726 domain-containing protein [Alphaproteobacteria bacterium]
MDSLTIIETAKTAASSFRQHVGSNEVWGVLVAALLLILFMSAVISRHQKSLWLNKLKKRNILTPPEQRFYRVLKTALPDKIILAQVSFNALITAKGRSVRARFNRLYADFVICSAHDFSVIAIVELDGETHQTDEGKLKDAKRDRILTRAGYRIERFSTAENLTGAYVIARLQGKTTA